MTRRLLLLASLALLAAACGGNGSPSTSDAFIDPGDGGDYAPRIDPAEFAGPIDHPYLPLTPGTHWTYEETSGEDVATIDVVVTADTKTVMGVAVVVVHDQATVDGELEEDTYDWYAQDAAGNVWYFGEATTSYEDGKPKSTEGSWEAGVGGALPGIVMPAHPAAGAAYRQEFAKDHAEDMARIKLLDQTVTVRGTAYDHVLVTQEWSPLEPDVVEEKYYAPGVGEVQAVSVRGEQSKEELTAYVPA